MGKDIYSFLNSNDVEAYLRQEKYEFNALQAAADRKQLSGSVPGISVKRSTQADSAYEKSGAGSRGKQNSDIWMHM